MQFNRQNTTGKMQLMNEGNKQAGYKLIKENADQLCPLMDSIVNARENIENFI